MRKLKDIPWCYGCGRQISNKDSSIGDELPMEDVDQEVVSAIRKSVEEKRRRKAMYMPYDFSWTFPPATEKLFQVPICDIMPKIEYASSAEDDEFHSAATCLSDSPNSKETIGPVMKSLSSGTWMECDLKHELEPWKKQQLLLLGCDCEGWPFGLLRKVVLLPPLPTVPSESWLWTKTAG